MQNNQLVPQMSHSKKGMPQFEFPSITCNLYFQGNCLNPLREAEEHH